MSSAPRSTVRFPKLPTSWPWLAAALSGLLLVLSFPPFDLGGLAWVALTPLIAALWFGEEWKKGDDFRCFALGYVTGLIYFLGCFAWVHTVTIIGWIALCLYLALFPALFAAFVGRGLKPRQSPFELRPVWQKSTNNVRVAVLVAATWTSLEWVRGTLFTGFGWNTLGTALHQNIALIQITDITGVDGLSFMLVMVNTMIVLTAKRLHGEIGKNKMRPHYDFSLTVAAVALVFAYGVKQVLRKPPETVSMSIAAVQGNIPVNEKRNLENDKRILDLHLRRSEEAFALDPDLLIWPEAATPRPINDPDTWDAVRKLAEGFSGDFLLGSVSFDDDGQGFNSALLFTEGAKKHQLYNKMHLVPFGEYVPMRHSLPSLAWAIGDLVPDDFAFGKGPVVLQMAKKPVKLAPLICFEDTLGDLARLFVQKGAQIFVTVTNDGWFLKTAESSQHLNNSIFRCAETKIPMIRSANTGITCVVDRLGKVINTLNVDGNTFVEGTLFDRKVEVPKAPVLTFYVRYGEVFTYACVGITALAGVWAFWRRERVVKKNNA